MNFLKTFGRLVIPSLISGVDPEIIMSDQMLLYRNESSQEKTPNFKGAPQTTYVKENHSLPRERIAAMALLSLAPGLEFVFKGAGKSETESSV